MLLYIMQHIRPHFHTPKARLAIYKVFWIIGCVAADVLSGIDKVVEDGVDVISLSLGGVEKRYNLDLIAIGTFGALQKGVVVSASVGNDGPVTRIISNIAPWITIVGASTIDRTFPAEILLNNSVALKGTSLYPGGPLPKNKTFPIIHFPSNSSQQLCMPNSLDKTFVKGKRVICSSGDNSSELQKGMEVKRAGGEGVIMALNDPRIPENATLESEPCLYLGLILPSKAALRLLDFISKEVVKEGALVFQGTHIGKKTAPILALFSSRDPSKESKYVLKPDLIAPGMDILAAWPSNIPPSILHKDPRRSEFNIILGTSMSCPHVYGVSALLKGAHPDWTPAMIRSALMITAYTEYHHMAKPAQKDTGENQVQLMSLYDIGVGHVDPEKANNPGLVLDISEEDYIQLLCASNYKDTEIQTIVKRSIRCHNNTNNVKVWDLNYPAIIITSDSKAQYIARSLTNVESATSSYTAKITSPKGTNVTVTPQELSFKWKGEKQNFIVE